MRAVWRGEVLAESDDTVVVEGNHYFPMDAVRQDLLRPSTTTSVCPWKGTASYYTIEVDGQQNQDAMWTYRTPLPTEARIAGRVASGRVWTSWSEPAAAAPRSRAAPGTAAPARPYAGRKRVEASMMTVCRYIA